MNFFEYFVNGKRNDAGFAAVAAHSVRFSGRGLTVCHDRAVESREKVGYHRFGHVIEDLLRRTLHAKHAVDFGGE